MKILNLYCGIGGNRRLWTDCEVTAVEINPDIAKIYQDYFPNDTVIIADAHQYLLNHYKEFDFIWSSPPCPTHSDIRRCGVHRGLYEAKYPDMKLYEEIIFLKNFALKETKWIVENVIPYYPLLIEGQILGRHVFWHNFYIDDIKISDQRKQHDQINGSETIYGFNLKNYKGKEKKRKLLRNMVNPELALHIFNEAFCRDQEKQKSLFD